ncbi:MAG: hypothetical protein EB120_00860 [Proteobacteria bacterium]|nr:hypothetical protein [Pseudomonadota bacterium]
MNELTLVIIAILTGAFIYQNKKNKDALDEARKKELEEKFKPIDKQIKNNLTSLELEEKKVEEIKKTTDEKSKEQLIDEALKDFFNNR